jgi:hypothetical protein
MSRRLCSPILVFPCAGRPAPRDKIVYKVLRILPKQCNLVQFRKGGFPVGPLEILGTLGPKCIERGCGMAHGAFGFGLLKGTNMAERKGYGT